MIRLTYPRWSCDFEAAAQLAAGDSSGIRVDILKRSQPRQHPGTSLRLPDWIRGLMIPARDDSSGAPVDLWGNRLRCGSPLGSLRGRRTRVHRAGWTKIGDEMTNRLVRRCALLTSIELDGQRMLRKLNAEWHWPYSLGRKEGREATAYPSLPATRTLQSTPF